VSCIFVFYLRGPAALFTGPILWYNEWVNQAGIDMILEAARYIEPAELGYDDTIEDRLQRFRLRQGSDAGPGQVRVMEAVYRHFSLPVAMRAPKVIFVRTGKRAGKTTVASDLVMDTMEKLPSSLIWICSNSYENANKLFEMATDSIPQDKKRLADPRLARFGEAGRVKVRSWENRQSLEADGCALIVCDEAQNLDEIGYNKLRSRILDTGGLIVAFGAPDVTSHFFLQKCEEAVEEEARALGEGRSPSLAYIYFPTGDNPLPEVQEFLKKEKVSLDPEVYRELYEGIPSTASGLVIPEFSQERNVRECLYDSALPVYLAIDPGRRNYSVLAAHILDDTVEVFDEVYLHDTTDPGVISAVREREWSDKIRYITIDVASKQKRAEAMKSTWQNWRDAFQLEPVCNFVAIEAGTKRLSEFVSSPANGLPRLFIDPRCKKTIDEFSRYRRNKGGMIIDAFNHSIKAMTYLIVDKFGYVEKVKKEKRASRTYLRGWR